MNQNTEEASCGPSSEAGNQGAKMRYVLAFDTANEMIAIGVGALECADKSVRMVTQLNLPAHRSSNTQLLARLDGLLKECGVSRRDISCVAVGRGPGSFTGVRIALATAKGVAKALGVGLVGLSTLDAVAWGVFDSGARGSLVVLADAMRKEVYPVRYRLDSDGVLRLESDRVMKAQAAAESLRAATGMRDGSSQIMLAGDALVKYADLFSECGMQLDEILWPVSGKGLLCAFQQAWRAGDADPFDAVRHDPAYVLPVYTRLSDAEENERIRLSKNDPKNLRAGVQDVAPRADQRATMHDSAILNARPDETGITYRPLDEAHVAQVAALEEAVMPAGAWSAAMVADELPQRNRVWWAALAPAREEAGHVDDDTLKLIGYAGGMVSDGAVEILRVGVDPQWRRRGIARELLSRVAGDARNLGAERCLLEVRADNAGAQALYKQAGLSVCGKRPRYYDDGEDALLMEGPLPIVVHDVGGMQLVTHDENETAPLEVTRPLILAIESSCDETAAAIVDGEGNLVADVVASQIDFHARFGGVVPEIASRKHIEAICGVCDECFEVAASHVGVAHLTYAGLDAVAVTYAPGLVGALVVGVAYAKGAAWAADKPFIGVNHLEGHLYANKIGDPDIQPPLVASLVSGGNTMLVHVRDWGDYETLGSTIDDAVGEAFDKVAKALGLGYPGGPAVSKLGAQGNPKAIPFPRAMMHSGDLRFSLSGLKTAVVTYINNERAAGRELSVPDICASFTAAVVDVQVAKARAALRETGAPTFCLGGGVAANPVLRAAYQKMCAKLHVKLVMPPLRSCGDNAGMIALVALERYRQGKFFGLDADAQARADLDKPY